MKFSLTLIIAFVLISCSDKVERYKIPGQYIFTHWGRDTIEMNSDGTYRHHTITKNQERENRGTWKLNSLGNQVTLENFSFKFDSLTRGNWISRIRVNGDEIHLMYASDLNAFYRKIDNSKTVK